MGKSPAWMVLASHFPPSPGFFGPCWNLGRAVMLPIQDPGLVPATLDQHGPAVSSRLTWAGPRRCRDAAEKSSVCDEACKVLWMDWL